MLGACGALLNKEPTHQSIKLNHLTQTPCGQNKQEILQQGIYKYSPTYDPGIIFAVYLCL